jgi:predicted 3-demethylubiquinone-9 3-methyltransferase (glyoxalase superfamily)
MTMQKITPFLWFDRQAEEAMQFYTSIFDKAKINNIQRHPEGRSEDFLQGLEGKVMQGNFELAGQEFFALDGGPVFKFTPAISFFVNGEGEAEVDALWRELSNAGMVLMEFQRYSFSEKFGWLKDKYGVSWQINLGASSQKIRPFLLFVGPQHGKAEEAMRFYTSLFEDSGIDHIQRFGAGEDEEEAPGTVEHARFRLAGQEFMAMDSGRDHPFNFNEAISFYVNCESQEEVDHFWNKLSAEPQSEQCGWLKDKYGVSWQIVPKALPKLLNDPNREKAKRVMDAMLQMKKIDVAELEKAYEGVGVKS